MTYEELNNKIKENKFIELAFDEIKDIDTIENKIVFMINKIKLDEKDRLYAFKYNNIIYIVDNKDYYNYLTCKFENEKDIYLYNANSLFNQYNFYLDTLKKRIEEGENSNIYLHQVNKVFDKYNETLKELKSNVIEEKEKKLKKQLFYRTGFKECCLAVIIVIFIAIGLYFISNKYDIMKIKNKVNNIENKLIELNITKISKTIKLNNKIIELNQSKNSCDCCININCKKGN